MSGFRTEIEIPKPDFRISHENGILLIGSCFSDNIGNKLINSGFNVEVNSFGTLYNPISIENSLKLLSKKLIIEKEDIVFHENLWKSFYHHSTYNNKTEEGLFSGINDKINSAGEFLRNSKYVIITFGTAWIFRYKKSNKVVSNCHKISANEFTRELLTVEDILESYNTLIKELIAYNPDIKIIFSVSPIRHLKDSAFGNQISKSTLILAINSLIKTFSCTSYFPAYEIFMDDLRDYRFYADDMIHPSQSGINYVWKRFMETYFSGETIQIITEVEKLYKIISHKTINQDINSSINLIEKITDLENKYPEINLSFLKQKLQR